MRRVINHLPQPRDAEAEKQLVKVQAAFGATVRRHRHEKLMTQEELAERADLHSNYVGSIERGERNVSLFNIWRIATALGLKAEELVAELPRPRARAKRV